VSIRLYIDVQIRLALTEGLRVRGIDVVTAQEDGSSELHDSDLLDRAGALGCVLFTHDKNFLREATVRLQTGRFFAGIIYAHQIELTIGQ
jgi:predicted nuclease of predicted toxin-antitoxin system